MQRTLLGTAALLLAIAFNVPFALLAAWFDYPDILRQPAGEVLDAFAAGGPGLVLTWYAFSLSAVGLILFAPALALTTADWSRRPGLAVGAALIGALAGLAQAIGLFRWVFAVPALAAAHADLATDAATRVALETAFTLANGWGGVAVGEHLGQMLTLVWVALAALQARAGGQRLARLAMVPAALAVVGIGLGLGEGLSLALGHEAPLLALATIGGYLAFSVWLVVTGVGLIAHPFFPARQTL
ncbi:MAG: DUF4386 family protein [Rhodobacterales bacterium]|nr:DUF4386 family protein [Rhodobacterales bacterium]